MELSNYNGWANYETWNVSLWFQNDEGLYRLTQESKNYFQTVKTLSEFGITHTPDGVSYSNPVIEVPELDECLFGLG